MKDNTSKSLKSKLQKNDVNKRGKQTSKNRKMIEEKKGIKKSLHRMEQENTKNTDVMVKKIMAEQIKNMQNQMKNIDTSDDNSDKKIKSKSKHKKRFDEQYKDKQEKKKKPTSYYVIEGIRKLIMFGALCVFTYSSYALTNIYLDYKENDDTYESLEDGVLITPDIQGEQATDSYGNTIESGDADAEFTLDFDKLKSINNSAVGWIRQDNIISYPIIMAKDNEYYLKYNALYQRSNSGAIFIDYRIPKGLEARNCIIYGHDMLNNSMFGSLIKYGDKSYYDEHKTFDIYIGDVQYKYYVFAAYETSYVGDTYTYDFASDEEFQRYIDQCMASRLYETDVKSVTTKDNIITLSTCTRHDEKKRFIVQMIKGEKVSQ